MKVPFHLPPMTTDQAIACWNLLEQLAAAIFEAHEEGITEVFTRDAALDGAEPPNDETWDDLSDIPW